MNKEFEPTKEQKKAVEKERQRQLKLKVERTEKEIKKWLKAWCRGFQLLSGSVEWKKY